ncbi:hypothetical protein ACWEKM_08855 [Streptomyces sp. NPDC004752]
MAAELFISIDTVKTHVANPGQARCREPRRHRRLGLGNRPCPSLPTHMN